MGVALCLFSYHTLLPYCLCMPTSLPHIPTPTWDLPLQFCLHFPTHTFPTLSLSLYPSCPFLSYACPTTHLCTPFFLPSSYSFSFSSSTGRDPCCGCLPCACVVSPATIHMVLWDSPSLHTTPLTTHTHLQCHPTPFSPLYTLPATLPFPLTHWVQFTYHLPFSSLPAQLLFEILFVYALPHPLPYTHTLPPFNPSLPFLYYWIPHSSLGLIGIPFPCCACLGCPYCLPLPLPACHHILGWGNFTYLPPHTTTSALPLFLPMVTGGCWFFLLPPLPAIIPHYTPPFLPSSTPPHHPYPFCVLPHPHLPLCLGFVAGTRLFLQATHITCPYFPPHTHLPAPVVTFSHPSPSFHTVLAALPFLPPSCQHTTLICVPCPFCLPAVPLPCARSPFWDPSAPVPALPGYLSQPLPATHTHTHSCRWRFLPHSHLFLPMPWDTLHLEFCLLPHAWDLFTLTLPFPHLLPSPHRNICWAD